jgi:teichuronic acid biosynthesis glycosyltransferase TuaC
MSTISTESSTQIDFEVQAGKKPIRVLMVTGVYPTEQRPHKGTFIKAQVDSLVAEGLEVEVVHPNSAPVPMRYASATMQVFLKTLTGHFDTVHGHYGLWCLISRLQWTTPVVASFLGDDLQGTVKSDGSYSNKAALVVHVSRWLSRRVDAVIVKSKSMKEKAHSKGNIFVIPNGVNFEMFRPMDRVDARVQLGWDSERFYILFSNDPEIPVKNFPLATAAIERLQARGISAELVIANGIPHAKVALYMNACNALILPSFVEGSPNVVKEAMACNIPVVASNVGDVLQVIGHTRGCSVCAFDPEAFADGLEEALRHTEPTTGRADIAHLEISVVAKQVIEIYELIRRKRIKSPTPQLNLEGEAVHGKGQ